MRCPAIKGDRVVGEFERKPALTDELSGHSAWFEARFRGTHRYSILGSALRPFAITHATRPANATSSLFRQRFPAGRADDFLRNFETPRSKRTVRSASLRLIPRLNFSSAAISRKPCSSSSRSWLTCSFRNSDRRPPCFAAMTWFAYEASKILAIAATCLPHSCVSLLSLFRPWSVRR